MAVDSTILDSLLEKILKLSAADRQSLVDEIWASIPVEDPPAVISETRRQELERRMSAWQSNPTGGVSLEDWERKNFGDS